jgi:hypothetical protein
MPCYKIAIVPLGCNKDLEKPVRVLVEEEPEPSGIIGFLQAHTSSNSAFAW